MRTSSCAAIMVAALLVSAAASAQETRASVEGFGGVGMGSFTTPTANFGGAITGDLTPNIQVIGEAGRLGNILPSTTQLLFDLSPVGLTASAFYAIAPHRAGVALGRMSEWIISNARMLEIVVGFGFGAVFLIKGVRALTG